MRLDSLKKFVSLRGSLMKEKAALEQRLAQINSALGTEEVAEVKPVAVRAAAVKKAATKKAKSKAKGGRGANALSLREAVFKATSDKALTKEEILKAIDKLGYKFSTDKPLASLNVVLYSKKQFKQVDGKFSPAK